MSGFFNWFPWWCQPAPPAGCVSFITQGDDPMSLQGTVTLAAPDPKVAVVKRTVSVAINGGTPSVLDATAGHVSFPVNDGDQVNVSAVDHSAGGVDSAPATWSGVAHDTVTVPASPGLTVSFAPAPAAA